MELTMSYVKLTTGSSCDYVGSVCLLSTQKESDIIVDSTATQMKMLHNFEEIPFVFLGLKVTDTTAKN